MVYDVLMIDRPTDTKLIRKALKRSRVVAILGPRQCGKTTLVRDLVAGNREFITMDDDTVLWDRFNTRCLYVGVRSAASAAEVNLMRGAGTS